MTQLKMAQQKFGDSMENMKKLQQRESGVLQSALDRPQSDFSERWARL